MLNFIKNQSLVFWDFDGVIKDSVDIKTRAYLDLFAGYGTEVAVAVRTHHEKNGGISRFDKIPLYLGWSKITATDDAVNDFCDRFSKAVLDGVVNSPWVPGVISYLKSNCKLQHFVLVTATPIVEIEIILDRLEISHLFHEVFGAPTKKAEAIANVIGRFNIDLKKVLMIGDSTSELEASRENSINFLLRRTSLNQQLQDSFHGPQLENFI